MLPRWPAAPVLAQTTSVAPSTPACTRMGCCWGGPPPALPYQLAATVDIHGSTAGATSGSTAAGAAREPCDTGRRATC